MSTSVQRSGIATEVTGVKETMRTLQQLEPALKREAIKKIKAAAEPLRGAIAARIPNDPPMSGWKTGGTSRLRWSKAGTKVTTRYGGRGRGVNVWPLVSISLSGAAASVYDMAGRRSSGNGPQGQQFIANLNRHGRASRAAWPPVESNLRAVQFAVVKAIEEVEDQLNREMGRY
jgi:hypothetical protein